MKNLPITRPHQAKKLPSGELLWVTEKHEGAATVGFFCIQIRELMEADQAECVLRRFMRKIRASLNIQHVIDAPFGTRGFETDIFQFWQDPAGIDWKVRVCSQGQRLAFLYVENIHALPESRVDGFLENFHWED